MHEHPSSRNVMDGLQCIIRTAVKILSFDAALGRSVSYLQQLQQEREDVGRVWKRGAYGDMYQEFSATTEPRSRFGHLQTESLDQAATHEP